MRYLRVSLSPDHGRPMRDHGGPWPGQTRAKERGRTAGPCPAPGPSANGRRSGARAKRQRPGSLPALTLFGLSPIPSASRHAELEPRLPDFDGFGAVLDPRAAFLRRLHSHGPSAEDQLVWGFLRNRLLTRLTRATTPTPMSTANFLPAMTSAARIPTFASFPAATPATRPATP